MQFFCATILTDSEFGSAWQTDSDSHVITMIVLVAAAAERCKARTQQCKVLCGGQDAPNLHSDSRARGGATATAGASNAPARVRDALKVGWAAESQRWEVEVV